MWRIGGVNPSRWAVLVVGFGFVLDRFSGEGRFDVRGDYGPGLFSYHFAHRTPQNLLSRQTKPLGVRIITGSIAAIGPDIRNQRRNLVAKQLQMLFATA